MLPGYHSPYQRSLKMDNIINLTDDMYIGNNWTSTSDFLDMYADDVEADSPYSSPTFGAGEHCSECGAPVVGIIERYCVNPGCVNGEVSAKFAFIPHNKLNVGLRLNLDEMLNVIADQLGCDCSCGGLCHFGRARVGFWRGRGDAAGRRRFRRLRSAHHAAARGDTAVVLASARFAPARGHPHGKP